jgi:hypothetical protein
MPRFQKVLTSDSAQPDGMVTISALDLSVLPGGGTATLTKIATGEISLRISTTTATVALGSLSGVVFRFGANDELQERFGSGIPNGAGGAPVGFPNTLSTASATAGSSVSIAVLNSALFGVGNPVTIDTVASGVQERQAILSIPDATHIVVNLASSHTSPFPLSGGAFTTPAGVSGSPPYAGVTEFVPVTAPRPKGIRIKQITPRYIVNTTAATANTIGVSLIQYRNNVVAPTATVLLTNAANGLGTAASANPYVTPIPIPSANQNFIIGQDSDVIIEWDVTAGTTIDLLGINVLCDVNYN